MIGFNLLLREAGIAPANVRLLRHQPQLPTGGALIDTLHTDRAGLRSWQALQSQQRRPHLAAPYWASFIGIGNGQTVLEGLYAVQGRSSVDETIVFPLTGETVPAGTCDQYQLEPLAHLAEYSGRLLVDWGGGASGRRAWIQRADNQDKPVTAILERVFEQPFPGYSAFQSTIGGLSGLTRTWISHLSQAQGIYLLTCPATGVHYIGSAAGADGFWGRWQNYLQNGHGGNEGLKGKDTRSFLVTILQVAGSASTGDEILCLEEIWKRKLNSRAFGLNHN